MLALWQKKIGLFNLAVLICTLLSYGCSKTTPVKLGKELKYKGSTLFYTSKVTEDEARRFGDYLLGNGFFQEDKPGTVQLTKEGKVYQFRMVVKKSVAKDMSYIGNAGIFAAHISKDVFNGKKVEIHLCDNKFRTLRTVTYNITPESLEEPTKISD